MIVVTKTRQYEVLDVLPNGRWLVRTRKRVKGQPVYKISTVRAVPDSQIIAKSGCVRSDQPVALSAGGQSYPVDPYKPPKYHPLPAYMVDDEGFPIKNREQFAQNAAGAAFFKTRQIATALVAEEGETFDYMPLKKPFMQTTGHSFGRTILPVKRKRMVRGRRPI